MTATSFRAFSGFHPLLVVVALACLTNAVSAQYSQVTAPFHTVNDSFFERIGVGFGFDLRGGNPGAHGGPSGVIGLNPLGQPTANGNIPFRQGGFGSALPPFGGHDAGSDANLGFAMSGDNGGMFFNFAAGQGSDRSFVTQAPTIVIPNGGQGTIIDTTQRPFVTGFIPVVGGLRPPYYPAPGALLSGAPHPALAQIQRLTADQQARHVAQLVAEGKANRATQERAAGAAGQPDARSTATRGDFSVADIRAARATEAQQEDRELAGWIERARGAEAAGKTSVAKIYYKMAARRAEGDQRQELLKKVKQLGP